MRDKSKMNQIAPARPRRNDDGLGPNSDIGAKLRTLYSQIQDEGTPDWLLDLLEKLDDAERKSTKPRAETRR
jgi:hypothetical protein